MKTDLEVVRDTLGAGMRQLMAQFDTDMQALLDADQALAAERARLADELTAAQAASHQAQRLADERSEEIDRLNAELRNARQVAADALVGKAKDQLAIDGKDAQLLELRQQLERNVATTATESDARLAAQMELVGIQTARDNLENEVRELRNQLDGSRTERSRLRAELESLRSPQ